MASVSPRGSFTKAFVQPDMQSKTRSVYGTPTNNPRDHEVASTSAVELWREDFSNFASEVADLLAVKLSSDGILVDGVLWFAYQVDRNWFPVLCSRIDRPSSQEDILASALASDEIGWGVPSAPEFRLHPVDRHIRCLQLRVRYPPRAIPAPSSVWRNRWIQTGQIESCDFVIRLASLRSA